MCIHLCVCVCVCVGACVCACASVCMRVRACACMHACVCAGVCVTRGYAHVCARVCVCACVCVTPVLQESSIWRMCVATGPSDESRGPHVSDSSSLAQDKEACVERGDATVELYRY